jgi:hypothetical protein
MNIGWIFPIVCLTMMVLCFFTMRRRARTGGCVRMFWKHEPRPSDGSTRGEKPGTPNETNRLDHQPVVPR